MSKKVKKSNYKNNRNRKCNKKKEEPTKKKISLAGIITAITTFVAITGFSGAWIIDKYISAVSTPAPAPTLAPSPTLAPTPTLVPTLTPTPVPATPTQSPTPTPEPDWQAMAEEYNNKGLDLFNLQQYNDAIAEYDKAIELEKYGIDNIDVCYYNRGRAYYVLGNYRKAIGDYTIAIDINPKNEYYAQRALAYSAVGDIGNEMIDNINAVIPK